MKHYYYIFGISSSNQELLNVVAFAAMQKSSTSRHQLAYNPSFVYDSLSGMNKTTFCMRLLFFFMQASDAVCRYASCQKFKSKIFLYIYVCYYGVYRCSLVLSEHDAIISSTNVSCKLIPGSLKTLLFTLLLYTIFSPLLPSILPIILD